MPLPKVDVPTYDLTIPSNGKKIKFRPYLVKEQKILLMANQLDDPLEILDSIKQVIQNCTFDSINIDELPTFDIEYIFLKLRAKSVGEIVEPTIKCGKCEKDITIRVDLNNIDVTEKKSNNIILGNNIGIIIKYPTLEVEKKIDNIENPLDKNYHLLFECTESIYDEHSVHSKKDFNYEEFKDFIESLNADQFDKILSFFDNQPKVQTLISYKCNKCLHEGKVHLQGVVDFLT